MVFLSLAAPFLFLLKDEKEFLIAKNNTLASLQVEC